jgi:hypothetical protein
MAERSVNPIHSEIAMPDKADKAEENDKQNIPTKKRSKKKAKKRGTKKKSGAAKRIGGASPGAQALYPRHSVDKALHVRLSLLLNAGIKRQGR